MRAFRALRGVAAAAGVAAGLLLVVASGALAAGTKICVPAEEGAAIVTPKAGACESGYTKTTLLAEAEQEKLEEVLPYVKYVAEGVDKKPTIQFTGVNVQVINGSGSESTLNGTGNVVVGYDETPGSQTGSHNLLLGTSNSDTSYAGVVAGHNNTSSVGYGSILGGAYNSVTGYASTITGGYWNKVSAFDSTISGGCGNLAGTGTVTVYAPCTSSADAHDFASVLGGTGNQASAENATVSGGQNNLAEGPFASSISGGVKNVAEGEKSSVSGGKENKALGEDSSVNGGGGGEAMGVLSSVAGGRLGKAPFFASTVLGGLEEVTEAEFGVTP